MLSMVPQADNQRPFLKNTGSLDDPFDVIATDALSTGHAASWQGYAWQAKAKGLTYEATV